MPRRRGSGTAPPGVGAPSATVPEGVGYALGYRAPKMAFHETRQASQYLEDLKSVLELTVRIASFTSATCLRLRFFVCSMAAGRRDFPAHQGQRSCHGMDVSFPGCMISCTHMHVGVIVSRSRYRTEPIGGQSVRQSS